jgi:hypothetical protein
LFPLHRDDRGLAKIIASANDCTGLPRPLRRVHHHAQGRPPSSRVTSLAVAVAPDPAITRATPFWRLPVAPFYVLRKNGTEQTAVAYRPPCGVRHSQADAEAPTTLAG